MSIRNLTTSTLLGQITQFKTSVQQANLANDEKASLKVVIDEIWGTFDLDQTGYLQKNEVKRFV